MKRQHHCIDCNRWLDRKRLTGLCRPCSCARTAKRNAEICRLRRKGVSLERLAVRFGLSVSGIRTATKQDLPPRVLKAYMADIIAAACEISGFTPQELRSHSKPAPLNNVRQAVYYIGFKCGHFYSQICRSLARDHSSVIHGKVKCEARMAEDATYADLVNRIMANAVKRTPLEPAKLTIVKTAQTYTKPKFKQKPVTDDTDELSDDELLSRAVAAHYARMAA